jgi:transposase-like protein
VLKAGKDHEYYSYQSGKQRALIMILAPVKCPHCGSENLKKNGKQRFLCRNEKYRHKTFVALYIQRIQSKMDLSANTALVG